MPWHGLPHPPSQNGAPDLPAVFGTGVWLTVILLS